MKGTLSRRIALLSIFCIAIVSFSFYLPTVCHGQDFDLNVDFSPNIINISSERLGDIRILTDIRYSDFNKDEDSVFIYFGERCFDVGSECSFTVENIKPSSDSLGNLILRFSLEDFLVVEDWLVIDSYNDAFVYIIMTDENNNTNEYRGVGEVYITDKEKGARE
jgi:hypothetical protein